MKQYIGIIYFKNGLSQKTAPCNTFDQAQRQAEQYFNQATNSAISAQFAPSRYKVQEI